AMKETQRGFTLVELLVVIAIIALLAGMLFPVFASARGSAVNARDLSNIRQIGQALLMYAQDADERYTPVGSWNDPVVTPYTNPERPGPGLEWHGWGLRLLAYTRNRDVFRSPWIADRATWWTGPCASQKGMALPTPSQSTWFRGRDGSSPFPSPAAGGAPDDLYTHTPNGLPLTEPATLAAVSSPASTIAFSLNQEQSPYGSDFGCSWG